MPPEGMHITSERLQGTSDHEWGQRPDGCDANLVPAPDSKGQSMPFQSHGMVGLQNHIGCGVIRIVIHRIRSSKGPRRRETNIVCLDINNSDRHNTSPSTHEIRSYFRCAEDRSPLPGVRGIPEKLLFPFRRRRQRTKQECRGPQSFAGVRGVPEKLLSLVSLPAAASYERIFTLHLT